ncbi:MULTISPECIES: hypothetical protein [Bradyrhizobium]|jgi:hypothetical protein|uniref:hypothetical protein n=1 Tax=Bradyrhizobium TaxID=374 RepID=UPI0012BBDE8A|nr:MULTISPECIES: hypothetical protein [Bradyrhizobium]MCS3449339.1 hypothetical protein [Bradyrhizobium elkanii]MCS3559518.1 hypothetical protein [Bradyrhizobium elkanii]MCW2150636.1 hypothetical protein [Bradyrhizobium elkanii]MCW2359305.1 hypothetical protein [Bradyrhizobium elkanii]MCW2374367.1 hypothetical protein [Bradyrhizobium elkanii]
MMTATGRATSRWRPNASDPSIGVAVTIPKNYAAGPEMVCPGGALFFQPLGPEIPSAENLLKITLNNCGLVHTKLRRRAGARARAAMNSTGACGSCAEHHEGYRHCPHYCVQRMCKTKL